MQCGRLRESFPQDLERMAQGFADSPLPGRAKTRKRCLRSPRCRAVVLEGTLQLLRQGFPAPVAVDSASRRMVRPLAADQLQPRQLAGPGGARIERGGDISATGAQGRGRGALRAAASRAEFRFRFGVVKLLGRSPQATAGPEAGIGLQTPEKQPVGDHFDPGGGGTNSAQAAPDSQPGSNRFVSACSRRWRRFEPAAGLAAAGSCRLSPDLSKLLRKQGKPLCFAAPVGAAAARFPPEVELA